jgi:pyridoxal phosphate enzyme (YggS family)
MPNIGRNLSQIRERIARACLRAGRDPAGVTLIAVTKTVTAAEVIELYRLGIRDFGENRIAEGLVRKNTLASSDARWHMIGHLQRNKAAVALTGGFACVHSVESEKLLDILDREAGRMGKRLEVFLEVNISGEISKYGIPPDITGKLARSAAEKLNLDLRGLMTMAPLTDDPEKARPVFRELARLRKDTETESGIPLPHLSMGMSGDFEVAIEEGATLVRVGTALFA